MPKKKTEKQIRDRENYKNGDKTSAVKLSEQYRKAYDYYSDTRDDWDEKEAILLGHNLDSVSRNTTKSQIFDPRLSTIVFERMYRVMNQLATGKVKALTKKNRGKSLMMDLILHNYVEPNAVSQYGTLLQKFRMENLYSHVYGSYAHLVDYVVRDDYVGPDITLISPYDLVPQPGKYNAKDCQYMFVGSWVSKEWLKGRKTDKWQNIDELLDRSKGDKTHGKVRDLDGSSYTERKYGDQSFSEGAESFQQIYLATRYENDRWLTFSPDYDLIVRDIANPHLNNRIPVVVKDSLPLRNRFFGLGEIERGKTLQYAINSLWNLYLDGVKFSIFPPKMVNLSLVVPSTIKSEAAANWVVKDVQNAIKEFPISPQGINTFQATYPALTAAMLNMAGTTDTSVSSNVDPGLGKTPQALALIGQRQNARDAYDRELQEEVIQETYDLMLDLISKKQETPIKIEAFDEEFRSIVQSNPDASEMFDIYEDGDGGELIIKPQDIAKTKYKFFIDKGSTYKQDEMLQKQEITDHLALAIKLGDPQEIKQTGKVRMGEKVIDVGELFKRSLIVGGMQDWDKVVYDQELTPEEQQAMMPQPEQDPMAQQVQQAQMQQAQMQQQMGEMPQQPMGQMPQANFEDPDINDLYQQIMGGGLNG